VRRNKVGSIHTCWTLVLECRHRHSNASEKITWTKNGRDLCGVLLYYFSWWPRNIRNGSQAGTRERYIRRAKSFYFILFCSHIHHDDEDERSALSGYNIILFSFYYFMFQLFKVCQSVLCVETVTFPSSNQHRVFR
jgi:hypothetical protein